MSSEVDEDKNSYSVLSIDGGGFRGFACLLILSHLMAEIGGEDGEETPSPRPCQVFDLICGTSTGGLIATLLGRFGLSCEEAIEVYKEVGPTMFAGETDAEKTWKKVIQGKLSSTMFERKLEDITARYTGDKDALFRPLRNTPDTVAHESTKTFVTVISKIGSAGVDAYRIRSYRRPRGEIEPSPYGHKWTVCEAVRATCATPLYLLPLDIQYGNVTYTFQDAGYSGFNNPAKVALDEAEKLFGNRATITLVSLGTGLCSLIGKTRANKTEHEIYVESFAQQIMANVGMVGEDVNQVARKLAKQFLEVATDTEISHLHAYEYFRRQLRGERRHYYRFNPHQGLGDIALTDYRQEATISFVTDAWLMSSDGRAIVSSASKHLRNRHRLKQVQRNMEAIDRGIRETSIKHIQSTEDKQNGIHNQTT